MTIDTRVRSGPGEAGELRRWSAPQEGNRRGLPAGRDPGRRGRGAAATDRQRLTTVLDALGRPRYQQRTLGADSAEQTLVRGLVEYDALGRVAFAAQPFPAPSSEGSKTYVTSYAYGYAAGQAAITVTGAAGNDPGAGDHTGVRAVTWSAANGRELERTILDRDGQPWTTSLASTIGSAA